MVEFLPLRGLRYAPAYAGPDVYAPPYDVIFPSQQSAYAARSPYNMVRLIMGPSQEDQTWHESSRSRLEQWRAQGILTQDAIPVFYGCQQHFRLGDGQLRVRTGCIGRVRLEKWGRGIFRHEHTRVGPRADRLKLLRATRANLSPVFGLLDGGAAELERLLDPPENPQLDFWDDAGVRQVFWLIEDPATVAAITESVSRRDVVIADGHHRYETAVAYQAERRLAEGNPPETQPYDYVLMYLTASSAPGLCILPSHRVVSTRPAIDGHRLLEALSTDFYVLPWPKGSGLTDAIADAARGTVALGIYLRHAGAAVLCLRDLRAAQEAASRSGMDGLAELDVCVLQNLILGPHLGITPEVLAATEQVTYTISEEQARASVDAGQAQAAFILNPTTVEQVWRAARRGVTLPQKSTYFHPKLLSGLVLNPLDTA
jgi:uncharacterized protein (DUF1015 family)